MPGKTEDPATLVTLPIFCRGKTTIKKYLLRLLKIMGSKNRPIRLKELEHTEGGRITLEEFEVPALKPYEEINIEVPLQNTETINRQFEAVIFDSRWKPFWKKVDDRHYSISYSGNWTEHKEHKNIFMGAEQQSTQKGASATFFFTGSQARCYGCVSKEMGSVDVYIDDCFIERIDCYFSNEIHNTVIYHTEVLPEGLHRLELRATGKHIRVGRKVCSLLMLFPIET